MAEEDLILNEAELIAEIETAFKSVTRRNGNSLHQAAWTDKYGMSGHISPEIDRQEWLNEGRKDLEMGWELIADDVIARNDVLAHLDSGSLQYYLPAFMRWTVKNYPYDDGDDVASGSTIGTVTFDTKTPDLSSRNLKRLSVFDAAQSKTIAHFLLFVAARAEEMDHQEDIRRVKNALDRYWNQFLIETKPSKSKKPSKRK